MLMDVHTRQRSVALATRMTKKVLVQNEFLEGALPSSPTGCD